jgi:hypothetical protein
MSALRWPRIQAILNRSLEKWKEENGREPRMRGAHEGHIGWDTKEELASSKPYEKQLVEPDKVGNGRSSETNLIRILRGPIGGYRRMPSGGPYLSQDQILEIARWIDDGMPD